MNELSSDEHLAQSVTSAQKVGVDSRRPCEDDPCSDLRIMECTVQFSALFVGFRTREQ